MKLSGSDDKPNSVFNLPQASREFFIFIKNLCYSSDITWLSTWPHYIFILEKAVFAIFLEQLLSYFPDDKKM